MPVGGCEHNTITRPSHHLNCVGLKQKELTLTLQAVMEILPVFCQAIKSIFSKKFVIYSLYVACLQNTICLSAALSSHFTSAVIF